MIIRKREGLLELYCQCDHAEMASRFAEAYGAPGFLPVEPRALIVRIVASHDLGWTAVDAAPHVAPETRRPRDFLHMPAALTAAIWSDSIRDAAEQTGPLGGVVVSRHFERLAGLAMENHGRSVEERKELERFRNHHARLRADWMRELEQPPWRMNAQTADRAFELLKACDTFSIFLLLSEVDCGQRREPCALGEGGRAVEFTFQFPVDRTLSVAPWPFAPGRLEPEIPCRLIEDRPYKDDEDLLHAFLNAEVESVAFSVVPGV
ncbi:MAG: DUF3891 family protein [Candidatus Sumerlaeota bacterium]|nr:DUF3891 family protein [Candidatus Sumerlaeota bacterium]